MSVSVIRTPEDRFADLPDIPCQPHYRTVDGLRLTHLDEGDGSTRRVLPRRADLVVLVARGDTTGSGRWIPLLLSRLRGPRAVGQAD